MSSNSKFKNQKSKLQKYTLPSEAKIKKLSYFFLLSCTFAFCLLTFNFLYPQTSSAQQSSLSIQFSPSQADLKTSEEKIVKVSLSSDQSISAFDLTFQTSSGLSIADFDNHLGFDNTFDPFKLKQVLEELNNSSSRIAYILNSPNSGLPKRVDLYLKIRGTTTGEGKITLDYNKSQVLSGSNQLLQISPNQSATFNLNRTASSLGFFDPSQLPALNYPENTAKINLKLKPYGAQNATSSLKGTAVAVGRVSDSKYETLPQRLDLTPNGDGTFSGRVAFPNFKDGTKFSLMLKVDNYLLRRICNPNASESKPGQYNCSDPKLTIRQGENSFDFSGVSLLPGDLGQIDGVLNGYDLSIVRNNLNKNTIEAVALADLNFDGKVDQADFEVIQFVASNTLREADQ